MMNEIKQNYLYLFYYHFYLILFYFIIIKKFYYHFQLLNFYKMKMEENRNSATMNMLVACDTPSFMRLILSTILVEGKTENHDF